MEGRLEQRIQFWAALGPFIVLLTLFVCFIKLSAQAYYLPLAALLGLPICWKWRLKGALISLALLTALLAISLPSFPEGERMWYVGVGVALALSFAVTALSFEEMGALLSTVISGRAAVPSPNESVMTERFALLRAQWRHDREDFQRKLSVLSRQLTEVQHDAEAARQSAAESAADMTRLQHALHEAQDHLQQAEVAAETRQQSPEVATLKMELDLSSRQMEAMGMQLQEMQEACRELQEERAAAAIAASSSVEAAVAALAEAAEELPAIEETPVAAASAVPVPVDKALRASEGRYSQLRTQFEEKNKVLEETRRHLFRLEGKVWTLQQSQSPAECPEDVRHLTRYIAYLEEEKEHHQRDIETLEDLLSEHLLQA